MYLWTKALHVISIICWMAGILYLYRLFIYDALQGARDKSVHDLLLVMQKRLYYCITLPAMSVALLTGLALISQNHDLMRAGWLHQKLLFVVLLKIATIYGGKIHKQHTQGVFPHPSKTLRILNEVPTVCMILIVCLVVLKP